VIVVDTNIIAYFIIDTNQSAAARRALRQDTEWMLPPRWRSEFRSVLHKRIGAGLLELEEAGRLHARAVMKFGAFERQPDTRRVLRFAREYKIDVYDAEFVALADEYEVALLTADEASLASRVPDRLVLRLSSFL
jgi:predicted nucleic acid-binding protein